jgi:hypothetical protein
MHTAVNPAAVFADLDDGAVILNMDTGVYYGLDPVGSRIWALISGGTSTLEAIVSQLEREYAVKRDRLEADVASLLRALEAKGLVKVAVS